jgi:L-lysine 6-transaminase
VQTGLGMTGKMWAYQNTGVVPDAIAFGKKVQMGGTCVGRRVEEIADNVFKVPSRSIRRGAATSSTWCAAPASSRSCTKTSWWTTPHASARICSAGCRSSPAASGASHEPRGAGLFCAFDVADKDARAALLQQCFDRGMRSSAAASTRSASVPHSPSPSTEIDEALSVLESALGA